MHCERCNYDFCWCCMGQKNQHNKWYALCPSLPFNICVNILLVMLAMIFMPVIFTVGPLIAAFLYTGKSFDKIRRWRVGTKQYYSRWSCCRKFWMNIFSLTLCLIIALPLCLALASGASALLLSFGTIAGLYYGFAYIIRITYYIIST